jgi:hypothetical protein
MLCEGFKLNHMGQHQWQVFVNTIMDHQVPCQLENFMTSCATIKFSQRVPLHELTS